MVMVMIAGVSECIATLILATVVAVAVRWAWQTAQLEKRRRRVGGQWAPGPWAWPLVGNLAVLARPHAFKTLKMMAETYGSPVVRLQLGSVQAMVVCKGEMAREILHTHDAQFSRRPQLGMLNHLLFGQHNAMVFEDVGPRWRALRKLWTTELLSQAMLAKNQPVRQEEMNRMLANIQANQPGAAVNILNCLVQVTGNIIGRLVISQRLFKSLHGPHLLFTLIDDTVRQMFTPLLSDFLPAFSWLDIPTKGRMDATRAKVEQLIGAMVEERFQQRGKEGYEYHDILEGLFRESGGILDADSRAFIYDNVLDMFIAGMDTSINTVAWAMAELLSNPKMMAKLQTELEEVVGLDRVVHETDLPKLQYLKAVIKEVFRVHPVAVLMVPHVCKEDCNVAGYFIPANTRVSVNLWAIGRDPSFWENPHVFAPERFLGTNIDVKGQHFGLLPFGSGRRMCAGMNTGLLTVEFTLASLVHTFNWSPLPGETIDLSESKHKATAIVVASPPIAVPTFRLKIPKIPQP